MSNALLGFLFCALVAIPSAAQTTPSVFVDESGPEGTAPVVTFSSPSGSSFFQGSTVTNVTCPNQAVLSECWNIDLTVQGTVLKSWGSPAGVELSEPGTTGVLSDSFAGAAEIPNANGLTADIKFQLFSDDPSGTLGGRAFTCQMANGCLQLVEDGTFQTAIVGLTECDLTSHCQSFDVFLKSDVGDAPVDLGATPEPATFLLFGTGLLCVLRAVRRTWPG
jgi:PEP-CTERM motif-containing protein